MKTTPKHKVNIEWETDEKLLLTCVCVCGTESSSVCVCAYVDTDNRHRQHIKQHTPTTLHNRYKDVIEYRQQCMTEQALRERDRQTQWETASWGGRTDWKNEISVWEPAESQRQRDREAKSNTEMAALCRAALAELMMHTALCSLPPQIPTQSATHVQLPVLSLTHTSTHTHSLCSLQIYFRLLQFGSSRGFDHYFW